MRPWKPRRALTHNLLVMPLNNCGYKAVRLSEQPAKREQLCGLGEVVVLCAEWHHLLCRRAALAVLGGKRGHAQRPALLATGLQSCRSSPLFCRDPVWHSCCTESAAECVCFSVCVCAPTFWVCVSDSRGPQHHVFGLSPHLSHSNEKKKKASKELLLIWSKCPLA